MWKRIELETGLKISSGHNLAIWQDSYMGKSTHTHTNCLRENVKI